MSMLMALILLALVIVVVTSVVWVETAQEKNNVQYAKRVVGRKCTAAPVRFTLKVDQSGVIAVIFSRYLCFSASYWAQFFPQSAGQELLTHVQSTDQNLYHIVYAALIVFFCYFYNSVAFNPKETCWKYEKYGVVYPSISQEEHTADTYRKFWNA